MYLICDRDKAQVGSCIGKRFLHSPNLAAVQGPPEGVWEANRPWNAARFLVTKYRTKIARRTNKQKANAERLVLKDDVALVAETDVETESVSNTQDVGSQM